MARKTKDEAERTRNAILNAAERVFFRQGVTHTSLEQVAKAANVTRGAVYWHFRDKIELCEAMMNRVFLPQEDVLEKLAAHDSRTPLRDLRHACIETLHKMMTDKQRKRVVTIINLRCEYADDMAGMLKRRRACKDRMLDLCERMFHRAQKLGQLAAPWTPRLAAITFQALLTGLIQSALEGRKGLDFVKITPECITAFFTTIEKPARQNA